MQNEPDTTTEDELVFSTLGSSIDEAYGGFEDDEDVDEVEFDSYDNED